MSEPLNGNDHDLLIRVDENVKNIIRQFEELKNGMTAKVATIEGGKANHSDMMEIKHALELSQKDHELRIRRLERWGFIAIGALAVLQIVISLVK